MLARLGAPRRSPAVLSRILESVRLETTTREAGFEGFPPLFFPVLRGRGRGGGPNSSFGSGEKSFEKKIQCHYEGRQDGEKGIIKG